MRIQPAVRSAAALGVLGALLATGYTFRPITVGGPVDQAYASEARDGPVAGTLLDGPLPGTGDTLLTDERHKASELNDPLLDRQWALAQMHFPADWAAGSSPGVIVAVLDTGVDGDHEDLAGKVVGEVNFTDSLTSDDVNGHGTRVAGVIAATSNNSIGIAGVAPQSRLLNVKVADDYGRSDPDAVARGVVWAVDHGANVINISIELKDPSEALERAVDYAWSRGVVIVAAAGNDASTTPVYPAGHPRTIAVAATGRSDELAPLSNHGAWVDVAAPGFDIYSTVPGNKYGYDSGTSFAAAYVSGLAALSFGRVTDRNEDGVVNDEVRTAIEDSCRKVSTSGLGYGCIDAGRLFSLLLPICQGRGTLSPTYSAFSAADSVRRPLARAQC